MVFHTSVLAYLQPRDRERFRESVTALDAEWVSNEAPGVVTSAPESGVALHCVVSRGGREPLACADPHGRWVEWTQRAGS